MARFHITDNGPKPCNATLRDCPVGGAHFDSKDKAELAWSFEAEQKFNPLKPFSRKSKGDPFSAHIAKADRQIEKLSKDLEARDKRQLNGTLRDQLAATLSDAELEERLNKHIDLRTVGLAVKNVEGGRPMLGLGYGGDYKTEEEYGIAHIAKSLREGSFGKDDVQLFEHEGLTVLAVRGEDRGVWDPNRETNRYMNRSLKEAVNRHTHWEPIDRFSQGLRAKSLTVPELKEELAGKVDPLPKGREQLEKAYVDLVGTKPERKPAIGEFQTGRALVIVTDDTAEAQVMEKLYEAHQVGALRMGNASGRSSSAMFYDDRDVPREAKEKEIRKKAAHEAATAYIAETKSKLRSGSGMLFAVSPRVDDKLQDVRESTYWLNYSPRDRSQITGPFRKDQLERIASGDYSDVDKD